MNRTEMEKTIKTAAIQVMALPTTPPLSRWEIDQTEKKSVMTRIVNDEKNLPVEARPGVPVQFKIWNDQATGETHVAFGSSKNSMPMRDPELFAAVDDFAAKQFPQAGQKAFATIADEALAVAGAMGAKAKGAVAASPAQTVVAALPTHPDGSPNPPGGVTGTPGSPEIVSPAPTAPSAPETAQSPAETPEPGAKDADGGKGSHPKGAGHAHSGHSHAVHPAKYTPKR